MNTGIRRVAVALAILLSISAPARAADILSSEGGRQPVILVHGYMGSTLGIASVEAYWAFMSSRLALDGYTVKKIAIGEAALQDIRKSAAELSAFVDNTLAQTGASRVDLVCHSEGGLIAKFYIKHLGGSAKVDDLVTLATPHRGTTVASIGPGDAARQMEVRSSFIRELDAAWDFPAPVEYTAIHSNSDEMVFPTQNGFFNGALNMNVNLLGHGGIMFNEFVYQMTKGALSTNRANAHTALPVKISRNGMTTKTSAVSLALQKCDHYHTDVAMEEMRISNNPFMTGASWRAFSPSVSWNLDSTMDGLKAVYVQYRKKGGLLDLGIHKESPVYVDYVFYDSTAPKVSITEAPAVSTSNSVTISLDASDNSDDFKDFKVWNAIVAFGIEDLGVKEIMISGNSSFSGAAWKPYSSSVSVSLDEGPGAKTIYVKVRDGAGNVSAAASRQIQLVGADGGGFGLIGEGDKDPVVLVHGYGGSIVGDASTLINWLYIYEKLKADGFDVYRISLSDAGLQDVKASAKELSSFVDNILAKTGASKVDVVCHSEGGLVARYYTKYLGGSTKVDDLTTISTPHRGTVVSTIGPGEAARQMEVGSAFLADLNSGDTMPGDIEYTALFSHGDEIVVPGKNGFFDGAVNVNYTMFGHAGILFHPDPYAVVKAALANKYLSGNRKPPVEILETGMSTSKASISLKLRPCNHNAPQTMATEMMVSTNGLFSGATWQPLAANVSLNIASQPEGLLGVHVKYRGADGVESPSYADYIMIDRTAPTVTGEMVSIDSQAGAMAVSLAHRDNTDSQLKASITKLTESYGITGIGATEMKVSQYEDFRDAAWKPLATAAAVPVGAGAGMKAVYFKTRDAAGNESAVGAVSTYVFDKINGYMAREDSKDPIVFVHGHSGSIIGEASAAAYWIYYTERLKLDGYSVHVIALDNAAMQDIALSASQLLDFVGGVLQKTGARKVDIVSHSEGGLVTRYMIKYLGGAAYIEDLVTISTPHRGTAGAEIMPDTAAKQMRVGSDFLRKLNLGDITIGAVNYTSIYTNIDVIVEPSENSFFQGAVNILVNDLNHATILFSEDVYRAVKTAIDYNIGSETNELPIWIEKDAMSTSSTSAKLTLNYYNHYAPLNLPGEMMLSGSSRFYGASWTPFSASAAWTIDGGDGLKAVYAKYRTSDGSVESPTYVDYIVLDRTAPAGKAFIQSYDASTGIAVIALTYSDNTDAYAKFNLSDPLASYGIDEIGVRDMLVSADPSFSGATWQPAASSAKIKAAAGSTVYAKFRDAAGNESAVYTAVVSAPPSATTGETPATPDIKVSAQLLLEKGWNMVFIPESIPTEIANRISSIFGLKQNIVEIKPLSNGTLALNPPVGGKALWVMMDSALSEALSALVKPSAGAQKNISLTEGWNVIGAPGLTEIPLDKITFSIGDKTASLEEARELGVIKGGLIQYTGGKYVPAESLKPFAAYLLKTIQPCVINLGM